MKLIKWLPNKRGIFRCPVCKKKVERHLTSRRYKSCGCAQYAGHFKHGEFSSKLYAVWAQMKYRCNSSKGYVAKIYRDRGITVCQEWEEFIPFRDWAKSHGYKEGLYLDRKKNDKGYSPKNCRWITSKQSASNRRGKYPPDYVRKTNKQINRDQYLRRKRLGLVQRRHEFRSKSILGI